MSVAANSSKSDEGQCIIKGSNNTEIPCIFPFRWNGKEYKSCVFRKSGSWCSTQVDENGNHIHPYYGNCPRKCKVDDSTKHSKGRSMDGE